MQRFTRRACAALVPAILCSFGIARGQDYSFLHPAANQPYANSYYAQSGAQGSSQTSYFAGVTQEQTSPSDGAAAQTSSWGGCDSCGDYCCDGVGTWRENTLAWIGGDAYKSIGDTDPPAAPFSDYMNSAGLVGGFNTGFALWSLENVRGQVGASYGVYDFKGRDTVSDSAAEQQTFVTLGVYKRSDVCCGDRLSWGLVYDQFWAHQWGWLAGELYVGQVRGIVGWATSEWNEFGVWGAFRTTGDNSVGGVSPPLAPLRAMNQYNVYWRHNFDFGGQTMLYIGGHDPADIGSWLFGLLGQAPLSDYTALYGNFTFALPGSETGIVGSNEEEWNVGFGLVYYFGGKAVSPTVSGRKGLPLLPVANNGSLLITD